jgi:phosphatidylglycerophosphate synthase
MLSLSRVIFMPLLFWLLHTGPPFLFLIVYILVGSTDFWDGYFARKLNLVTDLGKTLDSVADLFFYISSAYFLYFLFPEVILPNLNYLYAFFALLGFSFLLSAYLFRKPIMMHTSLLRFNGVLVYVVVILSFFVDSTYLVRAAIISYLVGFSEEILIFLIFGNVDRDSKSIFHLFKEKSRGSKPGKTPFA